MPGRPIVALVLMLACVLPAAGCNGGDGGEPRGQGGTAAVQPPGAYLYATEGFERIGGPLPGRLRYPARTTVTVRRGGCQLTERWDARPERWTEWRYCITGGTWRLRGVSDHHEFFGQVERHSYRCTGRAIPRPAEIIRGFEWTDRCRARGIDAVARAEVLSIGPIRVGGERVTAVHLRVGTTLRGRVSGAYRMESWLRRRDGLLLRRTMRSDTTVDSIVDDVPVTERYSLRILALEPARTRGADTAAGRGG